MPTPVSMVRRSLRRADRCCVVTLTSPPGGVNLMAFLTRFQKTCWMRAASALDMMLGGFLEETDGQRASPWPSLRDDLLRLREQDMEIERRADETELAVGDAGEVEQIVDEAGLELRIAADDAGLLADVSAEQGGSSSMAVESMSTGFSGVRSSWLSAARKSSLALLGCLGLLPRVEQLLFELRPLPDAHDDDSHALVTPSSHVAARIDEHGDLLALPGCAERGRSLRPPRASSAAGRR